MVEKPGCGYGAKQIALLAIEHPGQHMARHEHVRHQVHVPDALPVGGGRFGTYRDRDPGVGAEDVYTALRALASFHKVGPLVLVRNIASDRRAADLPRDRLSAVRVGVGHDHRFGSSTRESPRKCSAYASSAAGDDDDAVSYFHAAPPLVSD